MVCIRTKWKDTLFCVFNGRHGINLCSHVAQWKLVNKKSNVLTISYYIDITVWLQTFEHCTLEAWPIMISDHAPLVLDINNIPIYRRRLFRFKAMWLLHPRCKHVIQQEWQKKISGSPAYILKSKLCNVKQACISWNRNEFGNLHQKLSRIKEELTYIQNNSDILGIAQHEQQKQKELQQLLNMEEVFWVQKARKDWTKKGDRNTRYFHAIVCKRRAANHITRLKNHSDQWIDEDQKLRDHIQQHFQSMFQSESRASTAITMEVLNEYTLLVLLHLRQQILDREFNIEEIKKAAFQLGSWKAPGPDGILAMLFQKCWDTMGQTMIKATLSFL